MLWCTAAQCLQIVVTGTASCCIAWHRLAAQQGSPELRLGQACNRSSNQPGWRSLQQQLRELVPIRCCRCRGSAGGGLAATRAVLQYGLPAAASLAGGTHHAFAVGHIPITPAETLLSMFLLHNMCLPTLAQQGR